MSEHDEEVPLTAAEARLAALAREGHAIGERARAEEEAEARRIERRERRDAERAGRGYVRAAMLAAPGRTVPPLFRMATAGVIVGTALLFVAGQWGVPKQASAVGLGLLALSIVGFFGGQWALGIVLTRLERDDVRALPFPVRGYFRVLAGAPAEERFVRVRIRFRDVAPPADVLEGLAARVTSPATARLSASGDTAWTVESGPIRTVVTSEIDPTNATVLWWMRAVLDEVLLPLHDVYPLRSARFSG